MTRFADDRYERNRCGDCCREMTGHWGWALAGIWGALWGRFLTLAIHRLGLYEPLLRPRSRGSRPDAPRVGFPPLVHALSAGLALIVYARFVAAHPGADAAGAAARFLVYFGFVGVLLVIAAVDLEHQMIPDAITYPLIPAAFVAALLLRDVAPRELLIGIALGYAIVAIPVEADPVPVLVPVLSC